MKAPTKIGTANTANIGRGMRSAWDVTVATALAAYAAFFILAMSKLLTI